MTGIEISQISNPDLYTKSTIGNFLKNHPIEELTKPENEELFH